MKYTNVTETKQWKYEKAKGSKWVKNKNIEARKKIRRSYKNKVY